MTDHLPASGPTRAARLPLVASLAIVLAAACAPAPGGTPGPSIGPTPEPTPTTVAGIDHPTGARDIVLRFHEGGGFVPVDFIATEAPSFTLYGDGTVVFRDPQAQPPAKVGNVIRSVPFRTAKLREDGIQALLEHALGPGGLGLATGPYMGMAMDIPTATFTINVEGRVKEVVVNGLSPDLHQPQDKLIVTTLARFADRLRLFANDISGEELYQPAAYRGTLQKVDQAFGPVADWPWSDIKPSDFASGVNDFLMLRGLTPADVAELGIPDIQGGMSGLNLKSGDKLFSLAIRPLLPDEDK